MKQVRISLATLAAVVLLAGCVVGPDYQQPDTAADAVFSGIVDESPMLAANAAIDERWWERFNDPTLSGLVDEAIATNTDIRAATARVAEAQAMRRVALAHTRPAADASAAASRSNLSEAGNLPPGAPVLFSLFDTSLSASWEPDFFGRLRRRVEAADARLDAEIEERRNVLLVVLSELTLNYADLRTAQDQYALAVENTEVARKTLELAELLHQNDLAGELDLVRARADLTELQAAQADFEAAEHAAAARVAVLVGSEAGDSIARLKTRSEHELAAPRIPVGLASDLLARRPDVRAVERRLAAASADIGAELAERLPSFSLTGGLGSQATDLSDLFSGPGETWDIAGVLGWPLFDGGRRRALVDAAESRYEALRAEYDGVVLAALGDVEAAFASYVFANRERATLEIARNDRQRALELARLRYEAELEDMFPLLDAQRRLLALETSIAAAARAEIVAAINVYRALGGGWSTAEAALTAAGRGG